MTPSAPPPPTHRSGPRPLPLHLATANQLLLSSLAVWPSAKRGLPLWKPELAPRAVALVPELARTDPEAFAAALSEEVLRRLESLNRGIAGYLAHSYRRGLADPPALWRESGSRLLDYGIPGAPAVLLVPSLVNRGYVLDLAPNQSLARYLAAQGFRPLLLDWGDPGAEELSFDLTAYVARLRRAIAAVRAAAGGPFVLAGYCMGGDLALAGALAAPDDVAALALLATPWDFQAGGEHQAALVKALAPMLAPPLTAAGHPPPPLPVDLLQAFFWALDPLTALKKFTQFTTLAPGSEGAQRFVAVEDWLNDGVPLAGQVARECLIGWYGENRPACGTWRIAGNRVLPQEWHGPSLVVLPERDKLVPKASAEALLHALRGADRHDAPSGHIGMMVGPRAETGLWQPLAAWLQTHSRKKKGNRGPAA